MANKTLTDKLLDVKRQISQLGIEYLDTQSPFPLSDVGIILKPFITIDSALNQAIKKFSESNSGSIPKSNNLNRE